MNLRKSIKAVLTHLDADHLIILCYDQFPKLYATFEPPKPSQKILVAMLLDHAEETFEPPKPSQKILVAMLLDHAEETDQLKRLAKRFGLPTEKKEKGDKTNLTIGNIGKNFSGNIAGRDINR